MMTHVSSTRSQSALVNEKSVQGICFVSSAGRRIVVMGPKSSSAVLINIFIDYVNGLAMQHYRQSHFHLPVATGVHARACHQQFPSKYCYEEGSWVESWFRTSVEAPESIQFVDLSIVSVRSLAVLCISISATYLNCKSAHSRNNIQWSSQDAAVR